MPLDLIPFAEKVCRLRAMFGESQTDLATATGITEQRLHDLERAAAMPTGDEVLILADHFKEDFTFFISNEQQTALERTEKLFRAYAADLSSGDRWAIQEFLFLCENEAFLLEELKRKPRLSFEFTPRGTYFIRHGEEAARRFRKDLGYTAKEIPDVFHDMRVLGFHIFRRALENRNISGIFVNHPDAGPCLMVNYSEDVYRQRFTAAHEAAHAIFDRDQEYVVSFMPSSSKWSIDDLRERRADSFAGNFLVPPELLKQLDLRVLNEKIILELADRLKVNVEPLRRALVRDGYLAKADRRFSGLKIPRHAKDDPELPTSLTEVQRKRRLHFLQRGLSAHYVDLCFEACQHGIITRSRLAGVLLLDEDELDDLERLFQKERP